MTSQITTQRRTPKGDSTSRILRLCALATVLVLGACAGPDELADAGAVRTRSVVFALVSFAAAYLNGSTSFVEWVA